MLLELMFSLTVLSFGLLAVTKAFSNSILAVKLSQDLTGAMLLAESKLSEIETLKERKSELINREETVAEGKFAWKAEVHPLETPDGKLDWVRVVVSWRSRGIEREIGLDSLLLPERI